MVLTATIEINVTDYINDEELSKEDAKIQLNQQIDLLLQEIGDAEIKNLTLEDD